MNSFFNWLKDSGTQAGELFITACAAIGALLLTWYFGKQSLTKKDLARVEESTANTAGKVAGLHQIQSELYNTELIQRTAKRISIEVRGSSQASEPMILHLTTKDPNITLVAIQLTNDIGSSHGETRCEQQAPINFIATIGSDSLSEWFRSATTIDTYTRRVLIIRARLLFGTLSAERDIPVFLSRNDFGYTLNGNC